MKKVIIIIITVIIIFLILSLVNLNKDNKIKENNINTNSSSIKMQIEEGTLSTTGATLLITDNSKENYIYDRNYKIERLENNEWKELEYKEKIANETLLPDENGKLEVTADWSMVYGELSEGKYRLTKIARKDNSAKEIYVEFEI